MLWISIRCLLPMTSVKLRTGDLNMSHSGQKSNDYSFDVAIVGAGPVGLMLGCWLKMLGVDVCIFEKRSTRSINSKASSLNASSLAILHSLGLQDRFESVGQKVHDLKLYWLGKRLMRVNYRRLKSRYDHILCLTQPKTEEILEKHFLSVGGKLVRGVEVEWFNADRDAVCISTRDLARGTTESHVVKYVVGCDGGKSKVRSILGIDFPGADHGSGFVMFDAVIDWQGDKLSVHYFVNHDGFLIMIPLSDGNHRVIIKTTHPPSGDERTRTVAEFQEMVKQHGPPGVLIKEIVWQSHTRYYNRLASKYRVGRVFLAGDASHLFSSIGGLGMNTGFQDAFGLAWRLGGVVEGRLSDKVLDSYESERRGLTQALISSTDATTRLITGAEGGQSPSAQGWMPWMTNRQRIKGLPVHYAGLGQQYGSGLLSRSRGNLVGTFIPYFEFTLDAKKLCSYDLINGRDFLIVHVMSNGQIPAPISSLSGVTCISLDAEFAGHLEAMDRLSVSIGEYIFIRPDGIIAARGLTGSEGELNELMASIFINCPIQPFEAD